MDLVVQHRIDQMVKALWAEKNLRNPILSLRERFTRYRESVQSVGTYGTEVWPICKTVLLRAHQLEGGFLRIISRTRRKPGDSIEAYMRKATERGRKLLLAYGGKFIEELLRLKVHRFAPAVCGWVRVDGPYAESVPRLFMAGILGSRTEAQWRRIRDDKKREREELSASMSYKR